VGGLGGAGCEFGNTVWAVKKMANRAQKYVDWIFCYLDRSYLLPKQKSLTDLSVGWFRKFVFQDETLHDRIVSGACDLIRIDREGKDLDRDTLEKTISMFHELQVYTNYFEPRMLQLSQHYISGWADRMGEEMNLPEYVRAAQNLMEKEMDRVQAFKLDATTRRELLTLLENLLVTRREDDLSEFRSLPTQLVHWLIMKSKSRRSRRPPRSQRRRRSEATLAAPRD
jgi:cullin 4